MKKSNIYTILYSLVLIPIWGLTLLSAGSATTYTVIFCFLFTFGSAWLIIRSSFFKKGSRNTLFIFLGPLFYFLSSIFIFHDAIKLINSPITWVFFLFSSAFLLKSQTIIRTIIFVLLFTGSYVFLVYPSSGFKHDYSLPEKDINTQALLSEFRFINNALDTITLTNLNKPVLIETWNETCKPCISSIKDLQPIFASDTTFTYIYLYQNRGNKNLTPTEVFQYKAIKNSSQILIDIDNALFEKMELNSYPFFLVFNKKGVLADYSSGYNPSMKKKIIKKLNSALKEANK